MKASLQTSLLATAVLLTLASCSKPDGVPNDGADRGSRQGRPDRGGWDVVGSDSSGKLYIDHSRTVTEGSITTLVYMQNIDKPSWNSGHGLVVSTVNVERYDCSRDVSTGVRLDFYDVPMATGVPFQTIYGPNIEESRQYRNEGLFRLLWQIACGGA